MMDHVMTVFTLSAAPDAEYNAEELGIDEALMPGPQPRGSTTSVGLGDHVPTCLSYLSALP